MATMGRPRTHDRLVADALVDAAEALADDGGPGAVSVRAVAERSGTTTRAVYSLFGSKAGLVAALGARMFELLGEGVAAVPSTDDPAADLVEAGVGVFRRLSVERPALFQIGVQQTAVDRAIVHEFISSASDAFRILQARFERLRDAGRLPGRTVSTAALQFHALCEGLAAIELRGSIPDTSGETWWREALSTLLDGLAQPPRVQ
jgi:AcrR family transcriptional regulator